MPDQYNAERLPAATSIMTVADSWLFPYLLPLLRNRLDVLQSWRRQVNGNGRIKNLENWIAVELAHQLCTATRTTSDGGSDRRFVVLLNGFFAPDRDVLCPKRVAVDQVYGLIGTKSKAAYISVDLSVRDLETGDYLIAELKTGLSAGPLLDDLTLVRYYRDHIAQRSELGWVVLLPEQPTAYDAARKSLLKTYQRLERAGGIVIPTPIEDWLIAHAVFPPAHAR